MSLRSSFCWLPSLLLLGVNCAAGQARPPDEVPIKSAWRKRVPSLLDKEDEEKLLPQIKRADEFVQRVLVERAEKRGANIWPYSLVTTANLVVTRTHNGTEAFALKEIPDDRISAGEIVWRVEGDSTIGQTSAKTKRTEIESWLNGHNAEDRANLLFGHTISGRLTQSDKHVFVIEDLVIYPVPGEVVRDPRPLYGELKANKLTGIDLDTGKLLFKFGGIDSFEEKWRPTFSYSHFLGPPLVHDGKLWVLNEKKQVIRLFCIDPDLDLKFAVDGEKRILHSQKIAEVPEGQGLDTDFRRRIHAATPAAAGKLIICPTHLGRLVAVDRQTNEITWSRAYPKTERAESFLPSWRATPPLVANDRIAYAPPDSDLLICVNAGDGTSHWEVKRGDGLFPAGIQGGNVIVIGEGSCRAYRLKDGSEAWKLQLPGLPAGEGFLSGNHYYLPIAPEGKGTQYRIGVVDLRTGTWERFLLPPEKTALGNLTPQGDLIFSLTPFELVALPFHDEAPERK
jgi:outer membrane protein assembly factor BamB